MGNYHIIGRAGAGSLIAEFLFREAGIDYDISFPDPAEVKSPDFFDVEQFPSAAFEVTGLEEKDGKTWLSGNLTLKDKKNNVTFPVTLNSNNGQYSITSEVFTIDRSKWDVKYGSKSFFDNLGDKFINDDIEDDSLGDIFISIEQARLQADDYGHSFQREIGFLAVHGYLHLLGYDHHTDEEEKIMIQEQERILKNANLERN